MSGTKTGGKRTAKTNKSLYGSDFYKRIGKMGGLAGDSGGFHVMQRRDPERHKQISAVGGAKSRRTWTDEQRKYQSGISKAYHATKKDWQLVMDSNTAVFEKTPKLSDRIRKLMRRK